jgi:cold shock CspA family protein
MKGTVKWYSAREGRICTQNRDTSWDLFKRGRYVEHEVENLDRGPKATNVKKI